LGGAAGREQEKKLDGNCGELSSNFFSVPQMEIGDHYPNKRSKSSVKRKE
jgi:hypothetical protein